MLEGRARVLSGFSWGPIDVGGTSSTILRWRFLDTTATLPSAHLCQKYPVGFHVLKDGGDDAPSRKEISHVPVRLLLRRKIKQFNDTFHSQSKNNINSLKNSQPQIPSKASFFGRRAPVHPKSLEA